MEKNNKRNFDKPIILFDGICNLCNGLIQFILRKGRNESFKLETLQSSFGQDVLEKNNLTHSPFDSVILIENASLYFKSEAIFRIFYHLGGLWKIFLIFKLFPQRFNDYLYDLIARSRYRIFGKRKTCVVM
jgi:predicted DCC family thiol-disulfide oxidoreductase YuxK